jgi:hypothetical protein
MSCHCMAQGFCAMTRIVELGSPSQDEDSAKAARTRGAHQRAFLESCSTGDPGQSSPATRGRGFGPALTALVQHPGWISIGAR